MTDLVNLEKSPKLCMGVRVRLCTWEYHLRPVQRCSFSSIYFKKTSDLPNPQGSSAIYDLCSEQVSKGRSEQQQQINQSDSRSYEHTSASLHWCLSRYPGTRGSLHAPLHPHKNSLFLQSHQAVIFYTCITGRMNVGVHFLAFNSPKF